MLSQSGSETKTTTCPEAAEFSLVLGGPLFQMYRRTRVSGDALELLWLRALIITLIVWAPLLFFSLFEGHALGGGVKIPFLHDIEANVRLLIALPLLIAAEVIVQLRIGNALRRFVERGIVVTEDVPKFNLAINSALRARNSVTLEGLLLVLVYTVGLWIWRSQIALGASTWYAVPDAQHLHLTLAGHWYAYVSIPIFQFILLRWYVRLVLWFRLLWQVSRLNLHLTAAHPDRAGGIGFIGKSSYAFGPILFAQGTLLAGLIASRVLYEGQSLLSFKLEAAGYVGFFVLCIFGPLLVFSFPLDRAKRQGRAEYGLLANRYVFGFEEKWIRGSAPKPSELLGTGDLQSLADLANSYSVVREMRIVPFGYEDILWMGAAAAAPLLPLALIIVSPEELLIRLIKMLF
jgi:hypothetical protein